jgi:hypothetical protein
MNTQPTHWIAGTGQVIPVIILQTGTGGHNPSFVPPDPVVVRSIQDYYEFVASEGCLFTSRGEAIVEARRLRSLEIQEARRALARIEKQELLNGTSLFPMVPSNPLKEDSETQVSVVESKSSNTKPLEDVVSKQSVPEDSKPNTLLARVIYVIARDTISFDEICQRLEERQWFPKLRSSVSNVLSAHKNLFYCPTRGMYSLRSKPRANPIDEAVRESSIVDETETEGSESETEEFETSEIQGPLDEGEDDEPESRVEVSTKEDPLSEFVTWMDKSIKELTPEHFHFRDDDVVFSEKLDNGTWTAEVFVTGLDLWSEGSSEDRSQAREVAENNLRAKVRNLGRIVESLGII